MAIESLVQAGIGDLGFMSLSYLIDLCQSTLIGERSMSPPADPLGLTTILTCDGTSVIPGQSICYQGTLIRIGHGTFASPWLSHIVVYLLAIPFAEAASYHLAK